MVQQQNVEFAAEHHVILRGWLFVPDGPGPHPAITMAHGFAGVKEHGLERFAKVFAAAGFVVLVHDHRGFGASDGSTRYDIDPWVQIADWRRAISFLESQPFVDPDRIGLWGSSYAGGHAIVLGATDRRLRAVVAQVPTISGYQQSLRRVAPDLVSALEAAFADDERQQFHGAPPATQANCSTDSERPNADARDFSGRSSCSDASSEAFAIALAPEVTSVAIAATSSLPVSAGPTVPPTGHSTKTPPCCVTAVPIDCIVSGRTVLISITSFPVSVPFRMPPGSR